MEMYRNGQEKQTLHKHLGKEEEHTVFEAEVVGAILETHLASKALAEEGITISLNNQATIHTSLEGKQMAGQHLVFTLQDDLKQTMERGDDSEITLRWVPGHKGNPSNEGVDVAVKEAARGKTSSKKDLPIVLRPKSPSELWPSLASSTQPPTVLRPSSV